MIERVSDEKTANYCDELLTKLIQDEKQYNEFLDEKFEVKNYFKNIIQNSENILLCYKENNYVVGYIYLKPVNCDNRKGYLIDGLYVDESYRNKGIGKDLVVKGIDMVKNNCDFININVMFANKIAIELYKSLGFREFKINMNKNFN